LEGYRSEIRGVVNQDIETSESPEYLQRYAMRILFVADVADNSVSAPVFLRHAHDAFRLPGNECDVGSVANKLANQLESEAGRTPGYRHPPAGKKLR
jgi:hypothetical protein